MSIKEILKSLINALKIYFATKAELKQKQDIITDDEVLEEVASADILQPLASKSNIVFTSKDGKIYIK